MARNFLHSGYHHATLHHWNSPGVRVLGDDLVYPIFISDRDDCLEEIHSLPGQKRIGLNHLVSELNPVVDAGLKALLLFGVVTQLPKDETGSSADSVDNPVMRALPILREVFPNLLIACDVCLCAYTNHGHCGLMENGYLKQEESRQRIAQVALSYAKQGCHVVAPSDMMDARISAIKALLMEEGINNRVAVMSYSSKFASAFYGPFRDAAKSAPSEGDRSQYQLPPGSRGLAIRSSQRDADEGADILMVKPGGAYLDIIRDIRNAHPDHPLAVYQVSGEYAMIYHAAVSHNVFDLKTAVMESLQAMKRAGANILITYFTPNVLEWLKAEN